MGLQQETLQPHFAGIPVYTVFGKDAQITLPLSS